MTVNSSTKTVLALLLGLAGTAAFADPITITPIQGSSDGGNVGGYATEAVTDTTLNANDCIDSPTAVGGEICFTGRNGAESDLRVESSPSWWQYNPEEVFVTNLNWIEVHLPANTRSVSLWVGASFTGRAFVQAFSGNVGTQREYFNIGDQNTQGYGFYSGTGDSCAAITRIIIEPRDWGFGNLSINQGDCLSVPEPAPMVLLMMGLVGIGLSRFAGRS